MTQLFKKLESLHLTRLRAQPANAEIPVETVIAEPRPSEAATPPAIDTHAEALTAPVPVPDEAVDSLGEIETVIESPSAATQETLTPAPHAETPAEASAGASSVAAEQELAEGDQHLALVGNITQGSWFEMQDQSGQGYRCRLAAIIKPTGKYIFVNRSGMKVAEETRQGLALALKSGRLRILDDGMLFDRALEAVIGNLRSARAR